MNSVNNRETLNLLSNLHGNTHVSVLMSEGFAENKCWQRLKRLKLRKFVFQEFDFYSESRMRRNNKK